MVSWKDVWLGAVTTAAGFTLAKWLLRLYFSLSNVSSIYGSAGALVVMLAFILLLAEGLVWAWHRGHLEWK